jgi:hypothetical protein
LLNVTLSALIISYIVCFIQKQCWMAVDDSRGPMLHKERRGLSQVSQVNAEWTSSECMQQSTSSLKVYC